MKTEKSCGAIVYTNENGCMKYVIIRSKEGIYGFPKGHMEGSETEVETALREVLEETGLMVRLIDGFRTEDSHTFISNEETKLKHIVYFLGEYSNQIPHVQEAELSSLHLMDYETALSVFQYESSKRLLTEAHHFLMQL
jgi:tRNA nucleotidyltransferase (CCA-adding enzyme)